MHQGVTRLHLRINGRDCGEVINLPSPGDSLASGDGQMARRTKHSVTSYALARFLSALMQYFPHVAALAIQRAQNGEASRRSEAFLAKVQRIGAAGSFIWREGAAEIIASEQVYHIFDLDPALPLTLELMATRIHPEDLSMFHERIEQARRAAGDVDFEPRLEFSTARSSICASWRTGSAITPVNWSTSVRCTTSRAGASRRRL